MSWTDYRFSWWLDNLSTGAPWQLARINFRTERAELGPWWPLRKAYQLQFSVDAPPGSNHIQLNHIDDWGTSTELAIVHGVVTSDPMFVEVAVEGAHIEIWLNGDSIIDVVDPDPIAYGGIGVGAAWEAHARFDEVLVVPDSELVAPLDIKPGSCPNPFNRKSRGVLPVAVLGTIDFDVTMIDVSTVRLARADGVGGEVAPLEGPPGPHSVFEDVATAFEGELCDCHDLGADGYLDLSMKFSSRDVVTALELNDIPGGSALELVVTGNLLDETPFAAYDCIVLRPQR